jgi:hypothetical protein
MDPAFWLRIVTLYNIIALGLGLGTILYTLSVIGFGGLDLATGETLTKETALVNQLWFIKMSIFFFGVIGIGLGVHEIALLWDPFEMGYRRTGFIRAIFYAFMGFSIIGIAADLGIGSGILLIIAGAITLFFWILVRCKCMTGEPEWDEGIHYKPAP